MNKNNDPSGQANHTDSMTITTRQGDPDSDNQNVRTVGSRGPTTLENDRFLEKITHFDRERIPERVGAGAHGFNQEKMVKLLGKCEPDYGRRVAEGLQLAAARAQKGAIGSGSSKYAVKEAERKLHKGEPR